MIKMIDKMENTQKQNLLLSLSVFKKLYDENKDIYEIIASFIKCELSNPSLCEFSLTEMTQKINDKYNFDIPQAVVKISLDRIKKSGGLKLSYSQYIKLKEFGNVTTIDKDSNSAREERYILNILKNDLANPELSDDDIHKSLECYILSKNDKHNIFPNINSCITKYSNDSKFINGLNEIKYGLVIYEGISYGIESINPEKWNNKTIFLDTEILLHLGSYNGILFKKIADDFMFLINIVNQTRKINKTRKIVTLTFSEDVKKEIDNLFYVAELIVARKIAYTPNTAIKNILSTCNSGSDVISEKVDFYSLLSELGIKEYEHKSQYDEESFEYNLECDSNRDNKEQTHLKQVSSINILRSGEKYSALDKVKYLLLSETTDTINLSTKNTAKGDFPLVVKLFDLTNQLWIKTNKGLGNLKLPSTFDIRNKAKIALSASLAKKVSEEYDKVNADYKNKNIDEKTLIDKLGYLRGIDSNPDDINETNCEDITNLIINPDSIERHYEEKAMYKKESEDKSNIISEKDDKLKEMDEEKAIYKKESEDKSNIINEKDGEISKLKKQEEERKHRNKRIVKSLTCLSIVLLLFIFSDYFMPVIGGFIYVVGGLASVFGFLSFFGIDWLKIKSWCKKQ